MKAFYSMFNGISLCWKVLLDKPIQIGNMSLNKIEDIVRCPVDGTFMRHEYNSGCIVGAPDPTNSAAFTIDSFSEVGDIVLLYQQEGTYQGSDGKVIRNPSSPQVWLVDMALRWHFIAPSFSDYVRLMIVHLGIVGWQLIFTPEGLPYTTKQWMGIFCKGKLMVCSLPPFNKKLR
jgi:tubulin polyglutamylase complex subunit 2